MKILNGDEAFGGFLDKARSDKAGDVLLDGSDLGPLGTDFVGGVVLETVGAGADFVGVWVGEGDEEKGKDEGLHEEELQIESVFKFNIIFGRLINKVVKLVFTCQKWVIYSLFEVYEVWKFQSSIKSKVIQKHNIFFGTSKTINQWKIMIEFKPIIHWL